MKKMTRGTFLGLGALALPAVAGIDARWIEPTSLRVTELKVNPQGRCRFVHFADFHYKGDADFAAEIVAKINALTPDFVCFVGDLLEDRIYTNEALSFIQQINAPVYGVPGNHDYSSLAPFSEYEKAFAATGGAWLPTRNFALPQFDLELVGMGITGIDWRRGEMSRRVLLMHYPIMADRMNGERYDLVLAGHSHGGQVRLPGIGALVLPPQVGRYQFGHYETPAGPMYVTAGVGTYIVPIRFNCRPELTLVTI